MLKCGLDGIQNDLPLPDRTEENLFESEWARQGLDTLPGTLEKALDELEDDPSSRTLWVRMSTSALWMPSARVGCLSPGCDALGEDAYL